MQGTDMIVDRDSGAVNISPAQDKKLLAVTKSCWRLKV
jgi:hypothetical protein